MSRSERNAVDIRAIMVESVARRTGVDPAEVDPRQPFFALGLTSRDAVALCGELESRLGRPVPPSLPWRYSTVDSLAEHLAENDPTVVPGTSGTHDGAFE